MKIQHFRNATMVIETSEHILLVDPMLGDKGTMPPFTFFRFKPVRNPIVPLPDECLPILDRVTHCLITHNHPDHIDPAAIDYLKEKNIPVSCSSLDHKIFRKKGLNVTQTIEYWKKSDFLGGTIEGIPAVHGYGFVAKPAGNVMGYFIDLPDEPSIYLASDTIYTDDVQKVLKEYNPQITVAAAGSAQFDIFKPLLMTLDDVIRFTRDSPHQVILNHLEAVNHCPTTREQLRSRLNSEGLLSRTHVPEDGQLITISSE